MEAACIDRFEGEYAIVILIDKNKEFIVKKSILPKGTSEGDWLYVTVEKDLIIKMEINPKGKEYIKQRIQKKMDELRKSNLK
jgi:hypothetical protein